MLAGNRQFQGRSEARMSEPDQGAAAAAAAVAPRHRRACSSLNAGCPKPVSITSPCSRRAALSGAAVRFSARGDSVRYLYSILLARQQRLLSLFTADRLEAVRVGNAAEALDLRGGWMASRWRCSWPRSCRARRAWISSISGQG
jgi:hypothetical protein